MARKLTAVDRAIASAQAGHGQALVDVSRVKGRRIVHKKVRSQLLPDVRNQIIRIHHDCDPIGFLMDLVAGKPMEVHVVVEDPDNPGEMKVVTMYDNPDTKTRMDAAKFLADKFMPKMAVVNHSHMHRIPGEGQAGSGHENFAQMVGRAAQVVSGKVLDAEAEED